MDDWRVLLLFRVLAFDVGLAILLKIVSGKDQRQVRLVTQYVWSVIIVSLSSLYFGLPAVTTSSLLLLVLGALNGLAAYCTWRAMALSQSKNAALSQSSGILALPIAWVLLDEHHLLVQRLVLGGVLLGTVSWALFLAAERRQGMMAPIGQRAKTSRLLPWVAVYSLIWAVTAVAMRAYSLRAQGSVHDFMLFYYWGALVGTLTILAINPERQPRVMISGRGVLAMGLIALLTWVSRLLGYRCLEAASVTVVQPLFQAADLIAPLLIGLFVFHERKHMGWLEWTGIFFGIASATLLIVNGI